MRWDRDKERKAGKAYHMGSSVFGLIFAVFWCIAACAMGAWFMLIFGIPFVGMMAFRLVMISRHGEDAPERPPRQEAEPWEPRRRPAENGFCPYCGSAVEENFEYCPKCGRKLS